MKAHFPIVLALATAIAAHGEGAPAAAVVSVAGIAVVRENIDAGAADPYKPFGLETGTRLSLVIRIPDGRIVFFDSGDSSVDSLVDDKGTNLMALAHRLQVPGFLGHGCGIVRDGRAAHVEMFGGTVPAPGAGMVQARGKAVFFTGSASAKVSTPVVRAENGVEFKAGEMFHFQLARWEEGGIAGKGMNLSLRLKSHPAPIARLGFFDAEKNPIESRPSGVAVEGSGDKRVFLLHYQLASKPEEFSMEIEHWSDIQRLEVPFEVKAGLGGEP